MPKYKKRPDGRYATSVLIGYSDDGRAKRKVIYGRTIAELDNKVADFKSLKNKGIVIDDKNMTLEQWAAKWLDLYKRDKAYNTYSMYENAVNKHIIPALGMMRLSNLKSHQIQELLNSIVQDGHLRTAEQVRLTISQIIEQAIIDELIFKDITVGLSLPKHRKPPKRALTDAEKNLFLEAELDIRERMFIDVLYYAGLRRGEALALMINDIDLVNKKIKINKTIVMKKNTSEIKLSPKTEAGNRELPIPDKLLETFKFYLPTLSGLYLFTKQDGGIMTRSSFRRFWDNILDKFNVAAGGDKFTRTDTIKPIRFIAEDITPHIFRHTYATNLFYAGVDIKTAQYLLGHSSIQMTMDIYTHLDNKKILAVEDKLNDFFNNKKTTSDMQYITND